MAASEFSYESDLGVDINVSYLHIKLLKVTIFFNYLLQQADFNEKLH